MTATDFTCEALGLRIRVSGALVPRVSPLLAGMAWGDPEAHVNCRIEVSVDDGMRLRVDDQLTFETDDLGALVHQLVWEITQRAVGSSPHPVVLHAATVAYRGATVTIAGESGTGKSTLCAALVERGATYVTDEATALDTAGYAVTGLVRPIHLSRTSVEMVAPRRRAADVAMPGGGRYLLPERRRDRLEHAPTVVILLGTGRGDLQWDVAARSATVAFLARESFLVPAAAQPALDSLKRLSSHATAVTVSGGTVIDRAYLTDKLANQEKMIAPD